MKLTTKGRYGLRVMVELARRQDEAFVSLKTLAQAQEIPEHYLERLLAKLRRHELVLTQRGAQGGYRLGRRAQEISVLDILQAVGEPIRLVDCTEHEDSCPKSRACPANTVWARMARSIERTAREIHLDELKDGKGVDDGQNLYGQRGDDPAQ